MRNIHTILHIGCINLCSLLSTLSPAFIFWCWPFWPVWGDNFIVVLLSRIISDVEHLHLFTSLLLSYVSSLEKCLFRSSTHFLIGFFVFLIFSCMSGLYILEINLLLVTSFANIFSHPESCLFISFMVLFAVSKLVSLIRSFFYFLTSITLGGGQKRSFNDGVLHSSWSILHFYKQGTRVAISKHHLQNLFSYF